MTTTWTDQPEILEGTEVVARFSVRDGDSAEFRKVDGTYYLTVGGLFGSQTIRCDDLEWGVKMLERIGKASSGNPINIGDKLIENRDAS